MRVRKTLAAALYALALSTTIASATIPVPESVRCHDETTMYIGQLVDGKCRHPELPTPRDGYELGWDSSTFYGRDTTGHAAGGASPTLPIIRY